MLALAPDAAKDHTFCAIVGTGSGPATAARFFGSASPLEEAAAAGIARYLLLADRAVHVLPAVGTTAEDEAPALVTLLKAFMADPEAAGAAAAPVPAAPSGGGAGAANAAAASALAAASDALARLKSALPIPVQACLATAGEALAARGVDPAKAGLAGVGLVVALLLGVAGGARGGGEAPPPRRATRRAKRD